MKLKVCGMKYENNIIDVAEMQPDYLGFIFYENSPRYFNTTIPKVSENIKKIGVFVNAKLDVIIDKVENLTIHNKKQQLGQFMTTNYNYILQNFIIPQDINIIIEPFCGNRHLLNFIDINNFEIECYDIEPTDKNIIQQDTILNPPNFQNKYLITNPPYLARNKCNNKELFDKYNVNDLYKCHIKELIVNNPIGGILIIPLNFWSSIRKGDIKLRKEFLKVFNIILINIFEEKVFDDTTYTICSFQFELKYKELDYNIEINIDIYPSKHNIQISLNENNNYMIGGCIYNLKISQNYKISRITKNNISDSNTNILVKCIDDNAKNKIGLSFVQDTDIYIDNTPNLSARTYASLIIKPSLTINKQKKLIKLFNEYLNNEREKYHSLFLTNYRESKDIARKRISFDLVYKIIQYLLDTNF